MSIATIISESMILVGSVKASRVWKSTLLWEIKQNFTSELRDGDMVPGYGDMVPGSFLLKCSSSGLLGML